MTGRLGICLSEDGSMMASATMPIQRTDLLLEFIPTRDDGTATKVNTPTLAANRNGYAMDNGDSITLSKVLMDRVLGEGALGFTIIMALKAVAGLVGAGYTALEYSDPATDTPFAVALVQGGDASHVRLSGGIAYNSADYEGLSDAGNISLGSRVIGVRFKRTLAVGSRFEFWVDGVQVAGTSFVPAPATAPEVVAGTVQVVVGTVSLGDDPNMATLPNSPVGGVFGWKRLLTDAEMVQAMSWLLGAYPVF